MPKETPQKKVTKKKPKKPRENEAEIVAAVKRFQEQHENGLRMIDEHGAPTKHTAHGKGLPTEDSYDRAFAYRFRTAEVKRIVDLCVKHGHTITKRTSRLLIRIPASNKQEREARKKFIEKAIQERWVERKIANKITEQFGGPQREPGAGRKNRKAATKEEALVMLRDACIKYTHFHESHGWHPAKPDDDPSKPARWDKDSILLQLSPTVTQQLKEVLDAVWSLQNLAKVKLKKNGGRNATA